MKTVLEEIIPDPKSSFHLMVNPDLSDFFFWHFHPEFELVFLDGADGTRHVGEHVSRFTGSDLVFIGSYIPHLNFDYGIKTPYEKYVVHIKPGFLEQAMISTPELNGVRQLFDRSAHGIAFSKVMHERVGGLVRTLHEYDHFEQFIRILRILQELSDTAHQELLHARPVGRQFSQRDSERLRKVYTLVDSRYQHKIPVAEAAEVCHLSREAFCRYFKKMTRLTFTEFVNNYRIDIAKKLLIQDHNVTEACFGSGFESLSYFNRTFKRVTGKNPTEFRRTLFR